MVDNQRTDDLRLLYRCFSRREANLTCIVNEMSRYIEDEGEKIITNKDNLADSQKFTQAVLDFKDNMDQQVAFCFSSNIKFERGRDDSFRNFLNKDVIDSNLVPNFFALYLNNFLSKDCQGKTAGEIDTQLKKVIRIFCCFNERDKFVKECENQLHLRLLNK